MKIIFIGVLLFLRLSGVAQKNCPPNLDSVKMTMQTDFISLLDSIQGLNFSPQTTKSGIPKFIRKALSCWGKEKFRAVNPGRLYNNTDVIYGHKPMRQLNYMGVNENFLLLSYNHGGFGMHSHILVFKFIGKKIQKFWSIYGSIQSTAEIKPFLNRFSDNSFLHPNYLEF